MRAWDVRSLRWEMEDDIDTCEKLASFIRAGNVSRLHELLQGLDPTEVSELLRTPLETPVSVIRPSSGLKLVVLQPTPLMIAVSNWFPEIIDYLCCFRVSSRLTPGWLLYTGNACINIALNDCTSCHLLYLFIYWFPWRSLHSLDLPVAPAYPFPFFMINGHGLPPSHQSTIWPDFTWHWAHGEITRTSPHRDLKMKPNQSRKHCDLTDSVALSGF